MNQRLILGTVQFGISYGINNHRGLICENEVNEILDYAYKYIDTLDTANSYGVSEMRIGDFHKIYPNKKFKINTKFSKSEYIDLELETLKAINLLNVTKLDTIMFHSFNDLNLNINQVREFVLKNKNILFSKIGVSVYTEEELNQLISIPEIDVVQVSFNLLDNEIQKGQVLRELKRTGKEIHTRSCFLQGLFFKPIDEIEGSLEQSIPYLINIRNIAKEEDISMGKLALSYVLGKDYIDKVLIGVDSKAQLIQNLEWASKGLSEKAISKIDNIIVKEKDILNPAKW